MKSFLKQVAASFFGSCFSLSISVIAVFLGISALIGIFVAAVTDKLTVERISASSPAAPQKNSVLVIDLSREFSDAPTFSPANTPGLFSGEKGRYGLLDTLRALETAQTDDSIRAILLFGGNSSSGNGFATISELHTALLHFRAASGKNVFAYLPTPTLKDYLLATAADEIWLHPFSELPLNGLSSSGLYFKNALEKIGVGVQITRVGTYKSAVEPLISDGMSPEDRAQREQLINALWELTLRRIEMSRNAAADGNADITLPANFIKEIHTRGLLPAEYAIEKNFADAALYEDEMIERLKTETGTDATSNSFRQIALDDYIRACGIAVEPPLITGNAAFDSASTGAMTFSDSEPGIAVVYAEGEIVDGFGGVQDVGGQWFSRALRELRYDDGVKAVVLRINSPGGSVFASEQIRREVELLAEQKTLVVSMGDVAASGGYWISVPAKKVFADPMTITGSIGVFGVLFNFENLGKKIGVSSDAVLSSPFAELETSRRPKTPEEMKIFQDATNRIYNKFLSLVADARGMTVSDVDKVAQGQVWLGIFAKEKNLIDDFGGLRDAIEFARKDTGLDESAPIISVPGEVNRFQNLIDMFNDSPEPVAGTANFADAGNPALKMLLKNTERIFSRLRAFNDPNGIYARLPFEVETE